MDFVLNFTEDTTVKEWWKSFVEVMSEWRVACFLTIHGVVSDVRNIDVTKFTEFSAAVNIYRTDSMSKHRLSPPYLPAVMGYCHRYYRVDIDVSQLLEISL